ncbi:MAG: hypothetical protein IPJ88_18260 [Myxococcales bacterium]|nr:MAG: hypothetical protein IPJ88_18260 [Myxococcales bacterium]
MKNLLAFYVFFLTLGIGCTSAIGPELSAQQGAQTSTDCPISRWKTNSNFTNVIEEKLTNFFQATEANLSDFILLEESLYNALSELDLELFPHSEIGPALEIYGASFEIAQTTIPGMEIRIGTSQWVLIKLDVLIGDNGTASVWESHFVDTIDGNEVHSCEELQAVNGAPTGAASFCDGTSLEEAIIAELDDRGKSNDYCLSLTVDHPTFCFPVLINDTLTGIGNPNIEVQNTDAVVTLPAVFSVQYYCLDENTTPTFTCTEGNNFTSENEASTSEGCMSIAKSVTYQVDDCGQWNDSGTAVVCVTGIPGSHKVTVTADNED